MMPDYIYVIVMQYDDGKAELPRAYAKEERCDADMKLIRAWANCSPRKVKVPLDRCLCVVEHL